MRNFLSRCQAASSRGVGTITALGLTVLVVLFLLGLASHFLTAGVSSISARVTCGDKALLIARAAIRETVAVISAGARDPGNRIFYHFRRALSPDYDGYLSFEGKDRIIPFKVGEMIDKDDSVQYVVVKSWVPWQLRLYSYLPLEKYGQLHIEAEVGIDPGLGNRQLVIRRLKEIFEFKVAAPLPPEPFDTVTLFIMNMSTPLKVYEQDYRRLQKSIDDELRSIEDKYEMDDGEAGRPFRDNPAENVYRYFPRYRYPPFPLNRRNPPGPLLSRYTDMDNPIFNRSEVFYIKKVRFAWPKNFLDDLAVPVSYTVEGNSITILEGQKGTVSFNQGEMFSVQVQDVVTADVALNGGAGAVIIPGDRNYNALGQPVTEFDIRLAAAPNPGFNNDTVRITLDRPPPPFKIFNRRQQLHPLDSQGEDKIRRYETAIQSTLDDYGATFIPVAEDNVKQFTSELSSQLSWAGYVPRATRVFANQREFKRYVRRDKVWQLDGIYLVNGPLTINAVYHGNGVVVTRGAPVTVYRADPLNPGEDTLTVLCTDDNILLQDRQKVHVSLITPGGTVHGLENREVIGNVVTSIIPSYIFNDRPPGQVRFNERLRRTSPETEETIPSRYRFYLNRHPVATRILRWE